MFNVIFWGSGEIFHTFLIVFQASAGKKLWGKKARKISRARKFNAKHPANVSLFQLKGIKEVAHNKKIIEMQKILSNCPFSQKTEISKHFVALKTVCY